MTGHTVFPAFLMAAFAFGALGAAHGAATTFPPPDGYPANKRFKVSVEGKVSHVYDAKAST